MLAMVAVMIGIVVLHYVNLERAAPVETCELLADYKLDSKEKQRITMVLNAAGLNQHEFVNDRILVPKREHSKYLAAISQNNALPKAFTEVDDADLQKLNPFMPRAQQEMIQLDRKKRHIRDLVMRLPFVSEAWFEMDFCETDHAFQQTRQSAVIMIQPKNGQFLTTQQIATVRGLVSGAVAGLDFQDVVVADTSVGIAYVECSDPQQSQTIALVQWRLQRRQFYERKIRHALFEYVGLEIEVSVDSDPESPFVLPKNQTAATIPIKRIPAPDPLKTATRGDKSTEWTERSVVSPTTHSSVCANSQASIEPIGLPLDLIERSAVVQANYQQVEEPPTRIANMPVHPLQRRDDHQELANSEIVTVIVRVPQSLVNAALAKAGESLNDPSVVNETLDQIKNDIIAKIRPLLPNSSFLPGMPISVIMPTEHTSPLNIQKQASKNFLKLLQGVWPLAAITLIAILAAFWIRGRQKPIVPFNDRRTEFTSSDESDSQILQNQLANLIDKDPETAAKVIKNWIRQSN